MAESIIETSNIRSIKNAVRTTVNRNGLMAVVAEVGSGKTTMFNYLAEWWRSNPEKFRVVTVKSFESQSTRIGIIMRFLLTALSPETKIPLGLEARYKLLETQLRKYAKKSFKIILMIDEAQDLRTQTFYDIKKIHEIAGNGMDHLFSVIMFGKTSKKWHQLFGTPELGYRTDVTFMEPLHEEEIVKIAEAKYDLHFASDIVRKRFCASLKFRTPLGIKFFCESLKKEIGIGPEETAFVDNDLVLRIPMMTYKMRLKQANRTQAQFAAYCRQVSNRKINPQRVSEFFNGRMKHDDPLAQELEMLSEQYLTDVYNRRNSSITGIS